MRLSARCFAVPGLAYVPPWSVNSGFVTGEETTMVIDTGATALSAAAIYGYASSVRPHNRIAVLNTEPHFDHIGGNSFFRERGAEIYGHALIRRTAMEFEAELDDFNSAIANEARRAWREEKVFYNGTSLANPDHLIQADTNLDLGNCPAKILLTPGHTPSNASLWISEDRVLYCGDCLVNLYVANLDCGGVCEWQQWLESLQRIEHLDPAIVVPGHGPVATGGEVTRLIATVREELHRAIGSGFTRTSRRS